MGFGSVSRVSSASLSPAYMNFEEHFQGIEHNVAFEVPKLELWVAQMVQV